MKLKVDGHSAHIPFLSIPQCIRFVINLSQTNKSCFPFHAACLAFTGHIHFPFTWVGRNKASWRDNTVGLRWGLNPQPYDYGSKAFSTTRILLHGLKWENRRFGAGCFLKNSTPGMDVTSLRILCWKKVIELKVELKHAHCFQYTLNSARK